MSWFPVLLPSGESTSVPLDSSVSCGGSPGSSVSCGDPPSGAPSLSGSSGRRRGRRWRAGWGALAVVLACGAVACSGGGGSASSVSVPPRAPGEASASAGSSSSVQPSSAAASGAPTVPGEVTAESLSDPDSGYVVVSVPEDLDQAQREVVVAYVAFDKAAWRAYRAMDGDHSAVEAAATGQALQSYRDDYAAWSAEGLHMSGTYRMTVQEVVLNDAAPDEAVMFICVDQHDLDAVKADGTSGGKDIQYYYSHTVALSRSSGSWIVVAEESNGVVDQC